MKNQVFGKGKPGGLVVVGEAPGAEEIIKKEPFVGYSGKLLRQTIRAAGYDDSEIYFTNVCMCRPPENRTPSDVEVKACSGRLFSEIEAVQPKKILALGSTATQALLGKSVHKCQGVYHEWRGIPVMPAYHPAFILRAPEAFRDFAFAIEKLGRDPCNYYPLDVDGYPRVPYSVAAGYMEAIEWFLEMGKGDERRKITVDIEVGDEKTGHKLLMVGFSDNPNHTYIVPGHFFTDHLLSSEVIYYFDDMLRKCSVNSQNGGYEHQQLLRRLGIEFPIDYDTMLAHYSIDERAGDDDSGGKGGSYHGLGTLAGLYLDAPDWKGLMAPYREDYGLAPTDVLYRYLSLDVSTEHRLREVFEPLVEAEGMTSLVNDLYFPMARHIARIEMTGIEVDLDYFAALDVEWTKQIDEDVEVLRGIAKRPTLNIQSPKQVGDLLFNEWRLPKIDGTSTDKKVIAKLVQKFPDHEGLQNIAEIRSKKTILSTFIKGIPKAADPVTKRVHTRLLIHGTPTGRLASRDPNLQNQPSRIGGLIRDGFVATQGWDFLEVDYKQLEFCVLGFYSGDPNLIQFIRDGRDIHSEVAAQFFGIEAGTETKPQRLDAKTFVFGIPYGRGPESIASDFGIPLAESNRRYNILKGMFSQAFEWIKEMQQRALKDGYVMTYTGRKRRFPLVTSRNKAEILRQAANAPIQGLASDICLMASNRVRNLFDPELGRSLLLVHDSHLMEIREGHMQEMAPWIVKEMEKDPFPTPIPFAVDAKVGKRWGSLTKL